MLEAEEKKKRKRVSANQVRLAIKRVKEGEPVAKVAKDLGVHFTTVHNWKNKSAKRNYRTHNKTIVTRNPKGRTDYESERIFHFAKLQRDHLKKELEKVNQILKLARK